MEMQCVLFYRMNCYFEYCLDRFQAGPPDFPRSITINFSILEVSKFVFQILHFPIYQEISIPQLSSRIVDKQSLLDIN
jgi:hypothetical protein